MYNRRLTILAHQPLAEYTMVCLGKNISNYMKKVLRKNCNLPSSFKVPHPVTKPVLPTYVSAKTEKRDKKKESHILLSYLGWFLTLNDMESDLHTLRIHESRTSKVFLKTKVFFVIGFFLWKRWHQSHIVVLSTRFSPCIRLWVGKQCNYMAAAAVTWDEIT